MLKCTVIYVLLLMLFSCQHSESKDYQTIEIDYKNTEMIKASELFSDVRVIPLETREDYVIGRVIKVERFGDYYYILDETNNQVCVHDSTGRYLSKLDKTGRGADEYIKLIDMQINKDGIWVLDYTQQAILLYSFEYDLLKKIRFKCFPANFRYGDDKFYIYSELTGRKDDYCFYETTQNGKELQHFLLRDGKKRKYNFQLSNVFVANSDSLFSARYSNNIYTFSSGKCVYKLNFKDKTFPELELKIEDYDIYDTNFPYIVRENIWLQDSFIWISYFYNNERKFTCYDILSSEISRNGTFTNDLIPDFRFFPQWFQKDCWIDCIDAYTLVSAFPDVSKQFDYLKDLKEMDNPILVSYRLR